MKLLCELKDAEYGWTWHAQVSWGANWHRRACVTALEQIRKRVATMVNLKELETYVKTDIKGKIGGEMAEGKDSSSLRIELVGEASDEERVRILMENNFLVDVRNVRIKPGTDWTDTQDHFFLGRHWKASAIMLYDVMIYGRDA